MMSHPKENGTTRRYTRSGLAFVLVLAGVLTGYIVFHPFSMMVHAVLSPGVSLSGSLLHPLAGSFGKGMIPMAVAFSVFGGVIGGLAARLVERRRRLHEARLEDERKRAAIDAVHQLMVTLSHYLLNADAVIGGLAARLRRECKEPGQQKYLAMIENEAREIEKVLAALKNITELRTVDYTTTGKDMMIDLAERLTREVEGGDGGAVGENESPPA